jgi:hypothetical protein
MEIGLKPCQDRFLHPILVQFEDSEKNIVSQVEHTDKKYIKKRHGLEITSPIAYLIPTDSGFHLSSI